MPKRAPVTSATHRPDPATVADVNQAVTAHRHDRTDHDHRSRRHQHRDPDVVRPWLGEGFPAAGACGHAVAGWVTGRPVQGTAGCSTFAGSALGDAVNDQGASGRSASTIGITRYGALLT